MFQVFARKGYKAAAISDLAKVPTSHTLSRFG
ncbi:hypothetical protein M486_1674 [Yersinia pestis 1045]|uniref:HTH tetR-type domain-containing protein n=2 Tax=Yersinia pseudotuberculosis complex TaxID=1649845 RepID=A0AAX2HW32_YERPE|nr:hypothetical protein CH59_2020 [Yersinia pestis]AJI98712.1 hypothetical protein BZ18_532 [Yersinia pestis Pestoides F]AJJ57417.1 hypothetical protein BZ22_620 [Yersinia pseudotuberculosis YPIII]AJJ72128.1 hypothetical protein BZ23_3546 [Yersinia pseudotuberculosis]AJJ76157.1 hypothetical protein CH57_2167 [Yersinia pestis A1122]AJJ78727.1 hypothetical protein CH58_1617 [Yersinia pestis Antiqua]AJJ85691.1 hypothetical protein CH56_472 [Yersinia pestis Angola]AJJ90036.1 hypothetical protein